MKFYFLSFFLIWYQFGACDKTPTNNSEDGFYKIIPDNTPFITGLLEATNDTVHHYPEIVVGYVSDGNFAPDYKEVTDIQELYNPTLWTQVVRTLQRFELTFEVESEAKVMVKGPLNALQQKKVEYTYEGNGVYGDINSELELLAGHSYLLEVELSDKRKYIKKTIIPIETQLQTPDTVRLSVKYTPYHNGDPAESSDPHYFMYFNYPEHTYLTEIQSNNSNDKYQLFLEPNEKFLFEERGEFLRLGSFYETNSISNIKDSLRKGWWRDLGYSWIQDHPIDIDYTRISYFSHGIWDNFQNLDNWFVLNGEEREVQYERFEEALSTRDSTYLFDVSTIEKLGENGEILPKSENDAIGFFAGYFSVYKKTVLIPVRNFDLDSVLRKN